MHLPLNDIDAKNRPPLWFLWTQDGLNLACDALWSTAYILYIRHLFEMSLTECLFSPCQSIRALTACPHT